MSKMMVSCASPHRNNMLLHIRADPSCDFIPNSFEPRQRFASVRNSPNLLFAAAPLSSPENTIKIVHFDSVLPGNSSGQSSDRMCLPVYPSHSNQSGIVGIGVRDAVACGTS